jgi:NADH-quinone oxidoreductase subunit E
MSATAVPDVSMVVKKWKDKPGSLIQALHDLQNRYGFVPRDAALALAKGLGVPLARIYEVITFYNYFKLKAPGKRIISVCMGTACYLKGGADIEKGLQAHLGIKSGETTKDGEYHLQAVRCVGCCGLAPVVLMNEKVFAKVKPAEAVAQICPTPAN